MVIGHERVHLLLGIPGIGAFLTTAVEELGAWQSTKGCSILHPMLAVSGTHVKCACVCWGWDLFFSSSKLHTIGIKFHSFLVVLPNDAGW